jgi:hypothetical protein
MNNEIILQNVAYDNNYDDFRHVIFSQNFISLF